jgi:hypothetical protein
MCNIFSSVKDPDTINLYVFGAPVSESIIFCGDPDLELDLAPDPDRSINKGKNVVEPLFLMGCAFSMTCYL